MGGRSNIAFVESSESEKSDVVVGSIQGIVVSEVADIVAGGARTIHSIGKSFAKSMEEVMGSMA